MKYLDFPSTSSTFFPKNSDKRLDEHELHGNEARGIFSRARLSKKGFASFFPLYVVESEGGAQKCDFLLFVVAPFFATGAR